MNQCRKPRRRQSHTDIRNKNRFGAFAKNRVPVMASPEQIQQYESLLDIAQEERLTMYQVLEPFSHPDSGECGKLVMLTHLLYRLQVRQYDLDIALICANSRSEQLLSVSLSDRGLIYQSISTLLPEKESFGLIVKLRRGCLDDEPIVKVVDVIINYDGVFDYTDRFYKQFKQPHTQDKPPLIQLITMDSSESRGRSRLHKYGRYTDPFISLRANEVELFYTPTRTSWCSHFTDWNEYAAEDVVRWLVSTELDYKFQFPHPNAPLNEVYQEELQAKLGQKQEKFKFPKGRSAWDNLDAYLRPRLIQALSPKKQELIKKHIKLAIARDCFTLPRKQEAKALKQQQMISMNSSKTLQPLPSSVITTHQPEKETAPSTLSAIERFKTEFYNNIGLTQQ